VSQPQAQNDPQYLYKNIGNNKRENISSTNVEDALPPYEDGYQGKSPLSGWLADITLMDDAFLAEMEKLLPPAELSTPLPHNVENDNHSHSHVVQATRNEGEDDRTDTQHSRDNSAGRLRTGPRLPISGGSGLYHDSHPEGYQESAQRRGRVESATRKKASKPKPDELTLQGQHILDEYQKFKGRKSTPGKATIEAANGLASLVASDEELIAVLTEIRDNKYLNDNNIARDLDFVYRKYERYRDIVEQKQARTQPGWRPAPPPGVKDYTGMGKLLHQQEARRGQTFTA